MNKSLFIFLLYLATTFCCPDGFISGPNNDCFYFSAFPNPWSATNKICLGMNSTLASVMSTFENSFIQKHMSDTDYWLGGYREKNIWKWINGDSFEYSNWDKGRI